MKPRDIEREWTETKSKLEIGTVVNCTVFAHVQFGVFVNIEEPFLGLIEIPNFKEKGERMTWKEYPDFAKTIRAVVLGFNDRNHQVCLSARKSDLEKATK